MPRRRSDSASSQSSSKATTTHKIKANASAAVSKANDLAHSASQSASNVADSLTHTASDLASRAREVEVEVPEEVTTFGHRLADLAFGPPESRHRYISAFVSAFVLGTAVRVACFSPNLPIFGKYLENNLAPVERHDVSYWFIALLRTFEIIVGAGLWEGAGRIVDGPYLGVLLAGLTRPPLFFLLHEHYLLSPQTLFTIFLTDASSLAVILFVLSSLLPSPSPHFSPLTLRRPLRSLDLLLAPSSRLSVLLALISGTTLSAFTSFLVSRTYLPDLLRQNTLSSWMPSSSPDVKHPLHGWQAMRNPSILVPTLRYSTVLGTSRSAPSMPSQIFLSALTPLLHVILSTIVLPRAEPARIGGIVATTSAVVAFISLWNVMPLTIGGAAAVAAEIATREGATAALVAWILEDVRRPVTKLTVTQSVERDGTRVTKVTATVPIEE